jgi:hypothetical protein
MGLNVSNEQIAHELSIHESDTYQMTTAGCVPEPCG